MAGYQPARSGLAVESVADWMERRRREVEASGREAEAAAHDAWGKAARAGQDLAAARPSDVMALGVRLLGEKEREPGRLGAASTVPRPAPPANDLTDLRRQQAEFRDVVRDISRENRWMAVPALAPAAIVLGLEGAGWGAAQALRCVLDDRPLNLPGREPPLRGGDTPAAQLGRRAHEDFKQRVLEKPGWKANPRLESDDGATMIPDAGTPRGRYLELKPDTPSGRRSAARQVRRYQEDGKRKVRAVYYLPKDVQ